MLDQDAMVAAAAVVAGAEVVRDRFRGALCRVDKTDGDLATDVDIASEEAMRSIVAYRCPGDAIVGEEMGRSGAVDADRVWLLDPLCGTVNFAAGTGLVAVNAALVETGRVVAAAVADPFGGELAVTDGHRTWLDRGDDRALAQPSASSGLLELNFDPPFPNGSWFSTSRLAVDAVAARRFRPRVLSTTLGLAWVAMGHRAAYVTDGDVRDSVHFAAGIALCEAAGCAVTDLTGGRLGGADGLVVAADDDAHAALLDLIRGQRS